MAITRRQALQLLAAAPPTVLGVAPAYLYGPVELSRFSPPDDGSRDAKEALRAALAAASGSSHLRSVRVRAGLFRIDVAGDADSIAIPDNVVLECDEGVVFEWNYWGCPLFNIINRKNAGVVGGCIRWNGNFGHTSGARDFGGFGMPLPAYEWCAHITTAGSDRVLLEGIKFESFSPAQIQNTAIHIAGKPDAHTLARGLIIRNIMANDVCQGIAGSGQQDFEINGVSMKRYGRQSGQLYGPGHALYITGMSRDGRITNIDDSHAAPSGKLVPGAHTLSLKNLRNTIVENVRSTRTEGILNFNRLQRVILSNFDWEISDTQADPTGAVFASASDPPCEDVEFKNFNLRSLGFGRNAAIINFSGLASAEQNLRMKWRNVNIVRNISGTESNPAIAYVGMDGNIEYTLTELSDRRKAAVTELRNSRGNHFKMKSNHSP